MTTSAWDVALEEFNKVFEYSTEPMTGSRWVRENCVIPDIVGSSEQPFVPYPFQKGLLDILCTNNAEYERVSFLKSARLGWTTVLVGTIMNQLGISRRNILFYAKSDGEASDFVKDTIDPYFEKCPVVADAVANIKDKRSHDTQSFKNLNGKSLRVRGGTAGRNYRGKTVDTVIIDELDSFPQVIKSSSGTEEGSAISLASVRTRLSTRGRLVIVGSSPVEQLTSQIYNEYLKADAVFKFFIPCPHCGEFHTLEWEHMKVTIPEADGTRKDTEKRLANVGHICPECGAQYYYADYKKIAKQGVWRVPKHRENLVEPLAGYTVGLDDEGRSPPVLLNVAGDEVAFPKSICFEMWAAYAPDYTWRSLAADYIRAEDDPVEMKTFVNTVLGRPWRQTGQEISEAELLARVKDNDIIPNEYRVIYAAIDVQGRRQEEDGWLSMLITAYAPGEKAILLDRIEFYGDTATPQGKAWIDLLDWFRAHPKWHTEDGSPVGIHGVAIDSNYHTDAVYQISGYIARIIGRARVKLVRGRNRLPSGAIVELVPSLDSKKARPPIYNIGTHPAKEVLMHRFHEEGRIALAKSLPAKVIPELMAERLIVKQVGGRKREEWALAPGQQRNEALDCCVYTLAMHRVMRPYQHEETIKEPVKKAAVPEPAVAPEEPVREQLTVPQEQLDIPVQTAQAKPARRPRRSVFSI